MTHRLFVYGSLMSGLHNHGLLSGAELVDADARTADPFVLVALSGSVPALVHANGEAGGSVRGEVWAVDDATLARIDRLEGHPHWYQRLPLELSDGSTAWGYVLVTDPAAGSDFCGVVPGGDWRAYREWRASCT